MGNSHVISSCNIKINYAIANDLHNMVILGVRSVGSGFWLGPATTMYVCLCNGLTDSDIRRASDQGHRTVASAYCSLGAEVCCGRCVPMARELIVKQAQLGANISAEAAE